MRDPNAPDATDDDLREVPEHQLGQSVEGSLVVMPRPAAGHIRAPDFREPGTWGGDEDRLVRVAPFDALELDLPLLWGVAG